MRRLLPGRCAAVGVGIILVAGLGGCAHGGYRVKETRLGKIDANPQKLVHSSDGRHLAYVAQQGDKWVVVSDGVAGPQYDSILEDPVLSADGGRVAYLAKKGDKQMAVVDGAAGPEYDAIIGGSLVFSADGGRVAYLAKKGGKQVAVVDGVVGPEYDRVHVYWRGECGFTGNGWHMFTVSPDPGQHFTETYAMVGDDPGPWGLGGIGKSSLVFSADGKRVAYVAPKGDKVLVVVDGVDGPEYGWVNTPVLSADGRRVAYAAFRVYHAPA